MEHGIRIPWRRWTTSAALLSLLFWALCGCSHDEKPQPLLPSAFNAPSAARNDKSIPMDPLSRADQPGALNSGSRGDGMPNPRTRPPAQRVEGLSQIVQENVTLPGPDLTTQPAATRASASRPTTAGVSTGQYYEIGGVVMSVNGTPIYANKVISLLDPVFAAAAPQYNEQQFRMFAAREIQKQMLELRDEQLEYAAAERRLDQKDKDLADMLTMQWRQKQITAAGGSLTVARQRAAARGASFEDLAAQQYRVWMSRIYYEKKVMPRIQVSAADIRDYYYANVGREFTDFGTARFRLIKIDVVKRKGRDEALGLITQLRNRIVKAGESFESIARSVNDDPRWLKSGGDIGTVVQEHGFAIQSVDKAVWETPVGEVTPVIDAGNAFYLALVESKTPSKVQSFDDEAVQSKIDYQLRAEQFRNQRTKVRDDLLRDAAVHTSPAMMDIALEMAMQSYTRWAGK